LLKDALQEADAQEEVVDSKHDHTPLLWKGSPFPGLRSFTYEDEAIFFGRGHEIDAVIKRLRNPFTRFIAIVGASGSGKSSLVHAGVLPRLTANAVEGSKDWVILHLKPNGLSNGDPFASLAVALKGNLDEGENVSLENLATQLRNHPVELEGVINKLLLGKPAWSEIVLCIDEFEQLFTTVKAEFINSFLNLIVTAVSIPRIRILVTMRSDFYSRCVEYPRLTTILETSTFPLSTPISDALYEMITRPAERAGLTFEPGLVERILLDTGEDAGSLALMAFVLDELYRSNSLSKVLKISTYEALGGVQGAIGERAENVFRGLDNEAQAQLPNVFCHLCEVDEKGTVYRCKALLSHVAETRAETQLLTAMSEARLLVQGENENHQATVEVAHEALLRNWTRLGKWIEDTKDELHLARQVRLWAEYWQQTGSKANDLLTGTRLERAIESLSSKGFEFDELQKRYIEESLNYEKKRKREQKLLQIGLGFSLFSVIIISIIFLLTQNALQLEANVQMALQVTNVAQERDRADQQAQLAVNNAATTSWSLQTAVSAEATAVRSAGESQSILLS